jgi:mono/diheme cytochrome c family protein
MNCKLYSMTSKKFFFRKSFLGLSLCFFITGLSLSSCGDNENKEGDENATEQSSENTGPDAEDTEDAAASSAANEGKGVGPFADKTITVGPGIDDAMAAKGKTQFEAKCTACHKLGTEKYVGPGLKGVTERRKPEWILNMIINPSEMTQKDPQAKELLAEHLTQMAKQDVSEDDTRNILEYLRQNDKK